MLTRLSLLLCLLVSGAVGQTLDSCTPPAANLAAVDAFVTSFIQNPMPGLAVADYSAFAKLVYTLGYRSECRMKRLEDIAVSENNATVVLRDALQGMQNADATNQAQLTVLQGAVSTLQGSLAVVQGQVASIAPVDVSAINASLATLQAQVAALQQQPSSTAIQNAQVSCSGTSCTVTYDTNMLATGCVAYVDQATIATGPALAIVKEASGTAVVHTVVITGLQAGKTYLFWPRATDAAGMTVTAPPLVGTL